MMSDNQLPANEEKPSTGTMVLAGCSIVWIAGASLLAAFLVALGTLACGAICDQMGPVWLATGAALLLLLGFCLWLLVLMVRRRISSKMVTAMFAIDLVMLIGLFAFGAMLGDV